MSLFIVIGKSISLKILQNFIKLILKIIFNKRIIYFLSIYLYIYPPSFVIPQYIFFHSANNLSPLLLPSSSPKQTQLRTRKKRGKDNRFQIAPLRTSERYYVEIGKR